MKHQVGELLNLVCETEELYIYGWVSQDEAIVTLRRALHPDWAVTSIRYRWGRWAQDAYSRGENLSASLYLYDEPGAGRFKIMEIT